MKKALAILLSATVLSGVYGCKKKNQEPANSGSVMFVNGCAGTAPAIDSKVDNVNVADALNIAFKKFSGYRSVKTGSAVTIGFYLTNLGTPIVSQPVNIVNGARYSAFCAGLITSPSFVFTQDDLSAPATSSAKIRFVNLSNDALSVTANAGTTVIDSGVTSKEVTSFVQVSAGNYELKAGDPSNISSVVATDPKTLALGAGKIYTLMLTGSLTGTGESALKLTLINNN